MKILITNPTLHYSHGHKFLQPDWPSLTLPYLAAICVGHEVHVLDHSHSKEYWIKETMKWFHPDVIAFSIIAGRDVPSILAEIKNIAGCIKIAGGQGAAANARVLEEEDVVVFPDEAERALPHYLDSFELKEFDRIKLDESPMPRWDLVPLIKSRTFDTYTGSIEMSRGCPFSCDFCSIASFWHSFRQKSNHRIMKELKYLNDVNRRHVYLADDSFGINVDKHMELFAQIIGERLDIRFFTQIRADTVLHFPVMIKMAAKAGLYGVLVGFDSYDQDVLEGNNKTTTTEINVGAYRVLKENKIAVIGSHIYGLPGQTSFERTFKMGRKHSDLFSMPYFDGRPYMLCPEYDARYAAYVKRAQFSFSEVAGLLHPNKAIRELKRGGWRRYWNCTKGYEKERKNES